MFVSIVIAAYNEKDNLPELTRRIYSSMNKMKIPFELIYVIDGDDGSYEILSKMKNKKNLKVDYSKKPRGFRNAFVKGFSLVNKKSTHVLTMDADLNHQPEEIGQLISVMMEGGADIVVGSRYAKGGKVYGLALRKRAISHFANFVIKLVWGLNLRDKTSGYRLYKGTLVKDLAPKCKSRNFEFLFEMLILAKKLNAKILETPISFKDRIHGESKFDLYKVAKGYAGLTLRYKFFRK